MSYPTAPTIAVTGATGRIGGRVAQGLAADDVTMNLLVRDPNRAPDLAGAVITRANYADSAAVREALRGIDVVFMVSADESPERVRHHLGFVDAATAAGVEHLVYLSFQGAGPDAAFTLARDHWETEQYIRSSGLNFTFLRDCLYADFLPAMVERDGVIRGPAGGGRVAPVAQRDVADAAITVLENPVEHVGKTYTLTGPRALGLDTVAAVLSEATGEYVSYQPETVEEAYASRSGYAVPRWQVDAWVSTYTAIANGELEQVTNDVEYVIGRPATDLVELFDESEGPVVLSELAPGTDRMVSMPLTSFANPHMSGKPYIIKGMSDFGGVGAGNQPSVLHVVIPDFRGAMRK